MDAGSVKNRKGRVVILDFYSGGVKRHNEAECKLNPSKYADKCHCGSKITLISNLDTVMIPGT